MFEFLMLTSFALIIFSQQLPAEDREDKRAAQKPKQQNLSHKQRTAEKKPPCRNSFDRAA